MIRTHGLGGRPSKQARPVEKAGVDPDERLCRHADYFDAPNAVCCA